MIKKTSKNKKTLKNSRSVNNDYVYRSYYSNAKKSEPPVRHRVFSKFLVLLVIVIVIVGIGLLASRKLVNDISPPPVAKTKATSTPVASTTITATVNHCSTNTTAGDKLILVSISARHLWACDGTNEEYNSAVVTGYEGDPSDVTPIGTYHIYAKETDIHLTGSDALGSWNDFVYYWMPFLYNQYGAYGLHDATWRTANEFGNISPTSTDASHGCVELPLTTAAWIYNWAPVGTTVTVEA